MTMPDQIRTALNNVGRRKLRSTLASLGVVVGVVTVVVMVSLANGVRQQINRQFAAVGLDRLLVNSTGGPRGNPNPFGPARTRKPITPQVIDRWKELPGVASVMPEINLPAGVGLEMNWRATNQTVRLAGMDFRPGGIFQELPQALIGSLDPSEAGGIVVSLGTVQGAGVSSNELVGVVGQPVEIVLRTPRGEQQSFKLRIEGVSRERSPTIRISVNDRVAMKNWWFNSTNVVEREGYDTVTIRASDAGRASTLSEQLRKEGFSVQSLEAFLTIANRIVTLITVMFLLVGGIALLVATIGIANTMVMAIYERTREIGILKAMGASSREIRQLFMLEAGLIGFIGGVVGVGLGWLLGLVLNQGVQAYAHYRESPTPDGLFVVSLPLVIGGIGFAAFIGLLAGLLPAHRAARLNPLDALRHE